MKILHVTTAFKPSWETGGTCRVAYELCRELVQAGHDVTVFTTDRGMNRVDGPKNRARYVDGIRVFYFSNLSNWMAMKMKIVTPYHLPAVAAREIGGFDIIHLHEHRTLMACIVGTYARWHDIPYVVQAHGSILPLFRKQRLKQIFDHLWGTRILQDASAVIALNCFEESQYVRIGVPRGRVRIIPNGIRISEFEKLPKKGTFRARHGIETEWPMVLYLGRVSWTKGLDLLLKAFTYVREEFERAILVIAGPDDGFLTDVRREIVLLGIEDDVIVTGPLYNEDKLEALVDADVHVLPSRHEMFPLTVLESLACGTPVILTDRCGIAELIDDVGGIVTPFDANRLAEALLTMLTQEDKRETFAKRGKSLVIGRFQWSDIANATVDVYGECLETEQE